MHLTERQNEVLDAALALLVERGETPTMTAVADRASCSKETLYKWFGGREGLLTATVRRQASKVRSVPVPPDGFDAATLRTSLEHFAHDWLATISGDISVALNRLAVAETGAGALGRIVLENGPAAMRERVAPILEAGRRAGLLAFDDPDEAFRTFFGLVVRDLQIRFLLGDAARPTADAIARDARRAADHFFALYGAEPSDADGRRRTT